MKHSPFSRFRVLAGMVVTLLAVLAFASPPSAAHADSTGIAIIPPRFELFGNPGDTVVDKLRILNNGTTTQTYGVDIQDFKASDDEGGVALISPNANENSSYQLARWVTVEPTQFSVDAGTEKVLDITIKIPKNAEPGGHYASVLVRKTSAQTPGGAAVDTQVGSLILLRVSGDVKESANVDYFKAEDSFSQYGPVTLDLRTVNNGNVHIAPKGTIVITNMFNQKVAELPLTQDNVLPGSARVAHTVWDQKNLLGKYTATLVATYGQNTDANGRPNTLSATATFYVFPLYILWVILAVIVIILLLITQRKRVRKFINRITSD